MSNWKLKLTNWLAKWNGLLGAGTAAILSIPAMRDPTSSRFVLWFLGTLAGLNVGMWLSDYLRRKRIEGVLVHLHIRERSQLIVNESRVLYPPEATIELHFEDKPQDGTSRTVN